MVKSTQSNKVCPLPQVLATPISQANELLEFKQLNKGVYEPILQETMSKVKRNK